jgi:hypothetical protein
MYGRGFLGGFKQDCQDTETDLEISGNPKGLNAKQPRASSSYGQMHGRRGWLPPPAIQAPRGSIEWGKMRRSRGPHGRADRRH